MKSGWISINDGLPPIAKAVLCWCPLAGHGARIGYLKRPGAWGLLPTHWNVEVSHWMPVPDGPVAAPETAGAQ